MSSKPLLDEAETLLRDFSEQHFRDVPQCTCDLLVRLQRWLERKRTAHETPAARAHTEGFCQAWDVAVAKLREAEYSNAADWLEKLRQKSAVTTDAPQPAGEG